jgi:hypothetical protein
VLFRSHVGAAVTQGDGEIRGFAGDVEASRDADAFERLVFDELLADQLEDGHVLIGPLDFALTVICECDVFYVAVQFGCGFHERGSLSRFGNFLAKKDKVKRAGWKPAVRTPVRTLC